MSGCQLIATYNHVEHYVRLNVMQNAFNPPKTGHIYFRETMRTHARMVTSALESTWTLNGTPVSEIASAWPEVPDNRGERDVR